ncbi:MAG: hypothetical protein CMH69_15880 [Nitratireductor sp.]|nr:hypothetical protein [Nitratireductor sp.]
MTTLLSSSGDQKTGISAAVKIGWTRKLQAPATPHRVHKQLGLIRLAFDLGIVMLILAVAPQPFPGEVGRHKAIDIVVVR